jgi:hypothetical protein
MNIRDIEIKGIQEIVISDRRRNDSIRGSVWEIPDCTGIDMPEDKLLWVHRNYSSEGSEIESDTKTNQEMIKYLERMYFNDLCYQIRIEPTMPNMPDYAYNVLYITRLPNEFR